MRPYHRIAAVVSVAVLTVVPAKADEVTLVLHHFLSPKSPAQVQLFEPWAQRLSEQSDGRITIEIHPSMALGGAPPELYRQVRDGAADIVWTLIGYTPGVFPRSEVFELPTVHQGSAYATNLAIHQQFDLIAEDFEGIKPLLVHVHAGNLIHTRDTPVKSVADVQGLKLRTPSRTGAWMIEAWGAEPVGMPVPALPEALSRGTVDGALVPFEIFVPLKLDQLTKYSSIGGDGSRFGASVFLFAMNQERYDSMPDDLRQIIDDNIGEALSAEMGEVWNGIENPGRELQLQSGGEIVELDADAKAEFDALGQQVVDRWIAEAEENDIDGAGLVEAARAAIGQNGN